MWHQIRIGFLLIVLAACSQPTPARIPQPAEVVAAPTPRLVPQATSTPSGPELPGRIIFSAGGNLWAWQGEQGQQITTSGDAYQPALSLDGRQIVFVRRSQSASDLMLLASTGGEAQLLLGYTPDLPPGSLDRVYQSMWALYPVWSPDQQSVAFVSQYGPPAGSPASEYRLGLFGMPAQRGGERIQYYTDQSAQVGRLAYAPDGSGIYFALAPDPPGIAKIYRYDTVSGETGEVPNILEQSYDPAISPDGSFLAFAARHDTQTDIFIVQLNQNGPPIQITHQGTARAPAFSPDGKYLAFLAAGGSERGFDLWIAELTRTTNAIHAGEPQRLSFDMGIDADSGISWGK